MENRLGQHGQTSMEDREDNTADERRIKGGMAADPSYMYLKIQILWLARRLIQAFHVVISRYGGGAALAGFILQLLFFHVKARRANEFENEEQRHDWLERHNAQRQRWELVTSASALLVWNIVRQGRLRSSKDRGSQPVRRSWTQLERLQEKWQGVWGWLARLISPHLALMVTLVPDVKARATTNHQDPVSTAQPARRSSENSEAPLIKSEVQCHRVGYVHVGVQTETEDHSATVSTELSHEPAAAEQAAHIREIQSLTWPGQVLENCVSVLARFRALTSEEKRQKRGLTRKKILDTLTAQEMRDLDNLEPLDFEADYSTLRIPKVGEFHGLDGILSPSATNEDVWQLLVPALWTFALGRPTYVYFDGYSGTGKSYTMFKGPNAIAGRITWALDAFLRARGVDRKFDVATYTHRHDCGKVPRQAVQGPSAKGASLQEVQGKIEEAWQQREGTYGETANNLEYSRSHLIIELTVDVMMDGKRFRSSLVLGDLVGKTRGHDDLGATAPLWGPTAKEEAQAAKEAQERGCIHDSRAALRASLVDPSNMVAIIGSEFLLHNPDDLYVEEKTRNTPESKSQTPSIHRSPAPKVFLVSCLSPFKSKLGNTETTLNFATKLRSEAASGEWKWNMGFKGEDQ